MFESAYPDGSEMHDFHTRGHEYYRDFIASDRFPCIFGKTATRVDQYSFGAYDDITDPNVAEGVLHDLIRFQHEFEVPAKKKGERGIFRTSLVAFRSPPITDEMQGAEVLYTLLQNMHEKNREHYDWAEGFSNELESPDFGFSAGETGHFIAFFHPAATTPARQSDLQFIVFNSHHVVDAYKEQAGMDRHAKAVELIRSRQVQPVHPYLATHGFGEEFRQYALLTPDSETEAAEGVLRTVIFGEHPFQPKDQQ